MSYQVLARKWRPRNFQEVVGQSHVLTALSNGLARNRVHHAYLFSGTRGVGKTTIARILAKSLNCEQGVTATPCGQCVHCQAIDQGRFVDLMEIDAASRTKVDDTRELLDNVQYKPAQGRYKVYLIDEVHMLSKHSFNALLKTLEEPPEYVKFLLATTDPQKLPITVLSRCLQFHLKALLPEEIEKQLNYILQHEQATYEHAAITVIAKAADGSMRDALSLTDQALAFGAGNIEYQSVLKMLGTIDNAHLVYLLHFIVSGNVQKVFQKIEEFVHLGADFAKLHQELAGLCHQIALLQMQGKKHDINKTAMQLLAERLSPEEVQLYYQIALQGYKDYPYAPNGKIALEMTIMRLLAFKPANYIALDESQLAKTSTDSGSDINATVIAPTSLEAPHPLPDEKGAALPDNRVAAESAVIASSFADLTSNNQEEEGYNNLPHVEKAIVAAESPQEEQVAQQSVQQVTHSRNMLRSHRQKREEAKKSQAATNSPNIDDVVAAPADLSLTVNDVVHTKPESKEKEAFEQSHLAESSFTQSDIGLSAIPEHELPPVDSYLWDEMSRGHEHSDDSPSSLADDKSGYSDISAELPNEFGGEQICQQSSGHEEVQFSDQQVETPTIDIAKYVEDKITDPWSLAIQQMQLMGLVKLLAKNCVMQQVEEKIILTLKAEQQHLLNNSKLCEQLQDSLKAYYGNDVTMYIEIGDVSGQITPVEYEQALFQQYLDGAKRAVKGDELVQMLQKEYAAKIYENSIIPL